MEIMAPFVWPRSAPGGIRPRWRSANQPGGFAVARSRPGAAVVGGGFLAGIRALAEDRSAQAAGSLGPDALSLPVSTRLGLVMTSTVAGEVSTCTRGAAAWSERSPARDGAIPLLVCSLAGPPARSCREWRRDAASGQLAGRAPRRCLAFASALAHQHVPLHRRWRGA